MEPGLRPGGSGSQARCHPTRLHKMQSLGSLVNTRPRVLTPGAGHQAAASVRPVPTPPKQGPAGGSSKRTLRPALLSLEFAALTQVGVRGVSAVSARLRVFACSSVSVSVCVSGWLCVLVSAFACIPVGVCVCLSTCAPQHTCLPVCTCLSVTRGVCVTLCVHMSQCALVRTHVSGRGGCPHMSVCVCPGAHVRAHVPWLCVHICTSGHVCVNLGVHVSTCPCVSVCPHVPTWSLRVRAWESRYVSLHVVSWLKACVAWKSTFTVILDLANENKLCFLNTGEGKQGSAGRAGVTQRWSEAPQTRGRRLPACQGPPLKRASESHSALWELQGWDGTGPDAPEGQWLPRGSAQSRQPASVSRKIRMPDLNANISNVKRFGYTSSKSLFRMVPLLIFKDGKMKIIPRPTTLRRPTSLFQGDFDTRSPRPKLGSFLISKPTTLSEGPR